MALRFRDSFIPSNRPSRRGREASVAAIVAAMAVVGIALQPAVAVTSVDCDTADDFCTGDPCVTADSILVTVPSCVLDFSPRTLVIEDKVFVPNDGMLSLTAGAIEVRAKIDGRHTNAPGEGADITLTASGDILVRGRIDVAASSSVGTIALDAGGDIDLEHQLRARVRGSGATAAGGTISVEADGALSSSRLGKVDVRGRTSNTAGGQATLRGADGVTLFGRVEARGNPGGSVAVESSAGDVDVQEEIRVQGSPAGQVALDAAVDVAIGGLRGRIRADGGLGEITIDAGGVASFGTLSARGHNGLGLPGGTIAVVAGAVSAARFLVRGPEGGVVDVESTIGNVHIDQLVDVQARMNGGTVRIDSAADLFVADVRADASDTGGGEVRLIAAGNMTLGNNLSSHFRADADAAGGVIEGLAGGDLTAEGDFEAAVGGCIGLSAGGTLDTSQASFDVPLTASCP